jgi:hypothetical protein
MNRSIDFVSGWFFSEGPNKVRFRRMHTEDLFPCSWLSTFFQLKVFKLIKKFAFVVVVGFFFVPLFRSLSFFAFLCKERFMLSNYWMGENGGTAEQKVRDNSHPWIETECPPEWKAKFRIQPLPVCILNGNYLWVWFRDSLARYFRGVRALIFIFVAVLF